MSDPVDGSKAAYDLTEFVIGQVLVRAAELVEQGHCRRALARDDLGHAVAVESEHARCFCVTGAIARASLERVPPELPMLRRRVEDAAVRRLNAARLSLGLTVPGELVPQLVSDWTKLDGSPDAGGFIALLNWNDHGDTPPAHVVGALAFAALD